MSSEYSKIDPGDLIIDLPIDEAKVSELMESISTHGLLQPPNIWAGKMRIIDGFHRVVACSRLELTEINCILTDCDEEAFWDARIIAAKPHASISDERLGIWMLESWRENGFYQEPDWTSIKEGYAKFGIRLTDNPGQDVLYRYSVALALWEMDRGLGINPQRNERLANWFIEKSKKWGIAHYQIREKLLLSIGFDFNHIAPGFQERSLAEIDAIARQTKDCSGIQKKRVDDWVFAVDTQKTDETFSNFTDNKKRYPVKRQHKTERTTKPDAALDRQRQLARLDHDIDIAFLVIERIKINDFPETKRRLTALISLINEKIKDAFQKNN